MRGQEVRGLEMGGHKGCGWIERHGGPVKRDKKRRAKGRFLKIHSDRGPETLVGVGGARGQIETNNSKVAKRARETRTKAVKVLTRETWTESPERYRE